MRTAVMVRLSSAHVNVYALRETAQQCSVRTKSEAYIYNGLQCTCSITRALNWKSHSPHKSF